MTNENHALEQAKAQAECVAQLVSALNVDYDRLEELRDEKQSHIDAVTETAEAREADPDNTDLITDHQKALNDEEDWREEYSEELAELEDAAGDCKDADEASERCQENALDVQYRSGWANVGETLEAAEFMILLCTGGPAVRIMGELDQYMQPCRAWIQAQDWGTSWTQAFNVIEQSTLLEYCQQFYFGE